ncbi:MAG TPA: acyltransferase [Gammaproteobacteria bacterium]|nr:acyltransferase [Gammaproteobacteria bacterium]
MKIITKPWNDAEHFRINNFDAMRFFLAIMVIVSHAFVLTLGDDPLTMDTDDFEPLFQFSGGQITIGDLAVNSFFLVSGFLVTHSYLRSRGYGDYFLKRVRRIYPGFIVAIMVSLGVAWIAGGTAVFSAGNLTNSAGLALILHPSQLFSAFPENPVPGVVNGSLWTIQYEFWCYILVAMGGLFALVQRRGLLLGFLVFFATIACLQEVFKLYVGLGSFEVILGVPIFWPRLLSYFFAGACFYLWRDRIPHNNQWAAFAVFVLGVSLFIPYAVYLTFPFALTYLVMWLSYHPKIRFDQFARHGDFSYGIYLYAFPVQQLLIYFHVANTPLSNILLAVPLTIACGALSWHFVEKPFLIRKKKAVAEVGEASDEFTVRTISVALPTGRLHRSNPARH